jgi:hypothetical protein
VTEDSVERHLADRRVNHQEAVSAA